MNLIRSIVFTFLLCCAAYFAFRFVFGDYLDMINQMTIENKHAEQVSDDDLKLRREAWHAENK